MKHMLNIQSDPVVTLYLFTGTLLTLVFYIIFSILYNFPDITEPSASL